MFNLDNGFHDPVTYIIIIAFVYLVIGIFYAFYKETYLEYGWYKNYTDLDYWRIFSNMVLWPFRFIFQLIMLMGALIFIPLFMGLIALYIWIDPDGEKAAEREEKRIRKFQEKMKKEEERRRRFDEKMSKEYED